MGAQPGGLTLEIKRVLPAPPAVVFRAFGGPEEIAPWWGPAGFSVLNADFSPEPGRSYRIEMQPPEGDAFFLRGEFRQVDPPGRLSYTFAWEDPDPDDVENLVELAFHDLGGETEVSMRQGPFSTDARRELHRDGWSDTFDRLERHLAGG